jgi:hypothetical protein
MDPTLFLNLSCIGCPSSLPQPKPFSWEEKGVGKLKAAVSFSLLLGGEERRINLNFLTSILTLTLTCYVKCQVRSSEKT